MDKGLAERTKEEDEALRQKAVTYIQFNELEDFPDDHLFKMDF